MQKRIQLTVLLSFFIVHISFSQENRDDNYYISKNIEIGYSSNFGKPNNRNFHLLSVGLNKTSYGGRHGGGFAYGIGTDVVVNAKNITIGPKVNAFMYYQFIVIGSKFATYTDFKQMTFRYIPIIGIGGEKFKLTFNPHVILSTKKFQSINNGSIQFTMNFPLDRQARGIRQ